MEAEELLKYMLNFFQNTDKQLNNKNEELKEIDMQQQDILVKYKVLEDDNYSILQSWDGSRIVYEKGREETIIEITKV